MHTISTSFNIWFSTGNDLVKDNHVFYKSININNKDINLIRRD